VCRKRSTVLLVSLLIGASSLIAGCAPVIPEPLDIDRNESIVKYHKPVVPPGHKDYALHELQRGLLFLELGDYLDADMRFANACKVMSQVAGDEDRETAAVVWAESSKTYRGEPYERATAYFYRGLCHYRMKDYSGALAAFRRSLACDAETRTKEQKHLEDFTISHFMAAMCYWQLGEQDNAAASLGMVRARGPASPDLSVKQLDKNFVAVIAIGQGPYLRPSKIDASIKRIDCGPCHEKRVEVFVDGKKYGDAVEVMDLFVQAKSQDWGEMDSVRIGKRVLQEVVSHIPFVGMAANLIRSEADFRCWWGLPRKYYVFAADAPPGVHTVALKFSGDTEEHLPRYGQVWFDIPVRQGSGGLYYFRSTRNRQNHHDLEPKKINRKTESEEDSKS